MNTLTPRRGFAHQPHHALRRSVRRRDRHLAGEAELLQHIDRALHHRRIRIGTHQYQNVVSGIDLLLSQPLAPMS